MSAAGEERTELPATAPRRSRIDWLAWIDQYDRWLLPLPAVVMVAALLIFPAGYTLYLSFTRWFVSSVTPPKLIGLANYVRLVSDSRFINSFWHTVYFVGLAVALQVIVGLIMAMIFVRPFRGRGVARALFLLPMMATPAAISLVWMMMFSSGVGFLPWFVEQIGLPNIPFISDGRWVIPSLAMVDTWQWTPLVMLIILAGLSALPSDPYEAAAIDGASALQQFWYITLPLLRPAVVVAIMFRSIDALKTFETIVIITGGGPAWASETVNLYAFHTLFTGFHFGYGSAVLTALAVMVLLVAIVFARVRRGATL